MEIATYIYRHLVGVYPQHKYVTHELKVSIVDDSGKMLRIKFEGYHADGRPPGTVTSVQRKSVRRANAPRSGKTSRLYETIKNINLFRDIDPEDIRKPYKDD